MIVILCCYLDMIGLNEEKSRQHLPPADGEMEQGLLLVDYEVRRYYYYYYYYICISLN